MDLQTMFDLHKLSKLTEDNKYLKCFSKMVSDMPLGMPAIINPASLKKSEKIKIFNDDGSYMLFNNNKDTTILFPFSIRNLGLHAGTTWNINKDRIKIVDSPSFLENHVIKDINCFDPDKMKDEIINLTQKAGLSLIIRDQKGIKETISKMLTIKKWFKYYMLNDYYVNGFGELVDANEELICIMSFLNLSDCMPIFNTRKAFGFGLSFSLAFEKKYDDHTERRNIATVDLFYNNYSDNIFEIDGQVLIKNIEEVKLNTTSYVKNFTDCLNNYEIHKASLNKKGKKPPRKIKKSGDIKKNNWALTDTDTFITTGATDSSTYNSNW